MDWTGVLEAPRSLINMIKHPVDGSMDRFKVSSSFSKKNLLEFGLRSGFRSLPRQRPEFSRHVFSTTLYRPLQLRQADVPLLFCAKPGQMNGIVGRIQRSHVKERGEVSAAGLTY